MNQKDESAWMIERGPLCLGFGSTKGKISEKGFIWVTFTDPQALRYETKWKAELAIEKNGLTDVVVREHLFVKHAPEDTKDAD